MTHLEEEQLILHYYGEPAGVDLAHLDSCEDCRARYRELQRLLNVVDGYPVPELDANYERKVWQSIKPQLARPAWFAWKRPARLWAAVSAMAALLVCAFMAGRLSTKDDPSRYAGRPDPQRERVLLTAVGNHLEQSQFLLAEIANSDGEFRTRPEALKELVEYNRLYRQSAAQVGEREVEDLLDDLERLLLDLEHSSSSAKSVEELRRSVTTGGLLLKVRAIGAELRERQRRMNEEEGESL